MGINETDRQFIKALKKENISAIEELLASNAVSLTDWIGDLGVTALHLAVGYGTESFAAFVTHNLLRQGSDPNAPSTCGKTSVHVAAAWGRIQILHLLLLHGGDPWRQDSERKNAFNYAFELKAWDVIKVLHEFQVNSPNQCCRSSLSPVQRNNKYQSNQRNELNNDGSQLLEEFEKPQPSFITTNTFFINRPHHDIQLEVDSSIDEEVFINSEITVSLNPEDKNICSPVQEKKNETYTVKTATTEVPEAKNLFTELVLAVQKRALRISGIDTLSSWNETPVKENYVETEQAEVINVHEDSCGFISFSDISDNFESFETLNLSTDSTGMATTQNELDELREKLQTLGMNPGPITQSTKAIYQRQLERLLKQGFTSPPPQLPLDLQVESANIGEPSSNFCPELKNALNNPSSTDYGDLEKILCSYFSKPEFKGSPKTCFNYLLLDSRKTLDLPRRAASLSPKEILSQFLAAIFYVGKGQAGRPYAHLHLARQAYNTNQEPEHPKEKAIIDTWRNGHGITCLQFFHNIISDEALTREASMIHALGRQHLHNQRKGDYRGCVSLWDPVRQRMLGVHLLIKAKEIFLRDEERPLFPGDF